MIPRIPKHATVSSIFIAYRRCGATHAPVPRGLPWPRNVGQLSRALAEAISPRQLLEDHSMVPLFSALNMDLDPKRLTRRLIAGKRVLRNKAPQTAFSLEKGKPLRRCPQCVTRDLQRFGFAHWYVQHQVRQVRHCIEHRSPLESMCNRCGEAFLSAPQWQGADEGCNRCGPAPGLPDPEDEVRTSDGHWLLLEAIQDLLEGRRGILTRQPLLLFNAYRKRETTAQAQARIDEILAYFGGRTDEEFARLLCFPFSRADLLAVFESKSRSQTVWARIESTALWLALCVYCHHERSEIERQAGLRLAVARSDPDWDYLDLR